MIEKKKELIKEIKNKLKPIGTDFSKIGQYHTTICKGCHDSVRAECSVYVFPCKAIRFIEKVLKELGGKRDFHYCDSRCVKTKNFEG